MKKKPEHLEIKFHQPQLFFILTNKMHSLSETPFVIHFDVFPHKILHVFVHKVWKKIKFFRSSIVSFGEKNDREGVVK